MIRDKLATLVDNLPATASGALGDVIDLQKTKLDIGTGYPIFLAVTSKTEVTGGPATLSLVTSDNEDLSDNSPVITVDVKAGQAGDLYTAVSLPVGEYKRYLGVSMGGTALTAGNLDVALVLDVPNSKTYPHG